MNTELCLVICFFVGVLVFFLLKQSCGCGAVVEGQEIRYSGYCPDAGVPVLDCGKVMINPLQVDGGCSKYIAKKNNETAYKCTSTGQYFTCKEDHESLACRPHNAQLIADIVAEASGAPAAAKAEAVCQSATRIRQGERHFSGSVGEFAWCNALGKIMPAVVEANLIEDRLEVRG
jgi:hypothetical protein